MHIVDTTLFFAPQSGGVRRYLLAKRRHLAAQAGIRHTLVVPGVRDGETAAGIVALRSTRIPFGAGYRFPLRRRAWASTIGELRPDVVEIGDPYLPAWAALDAADRLGIPAVAFAHSDLPRLVESRCGKLAAEAANLYLARLYARFDLVFAPSRAVARDLRRLGLDRVVVQPLGVDGEVFHPARRDPELRAKLGLPADTRLLIFAGRMAREKRIPLLRQALDGLGAPYHLLLVGGDRHRRLSPCITQLPFQDDERRLACLLASCDALVHAGDRETFGLVVLEAMACGRPAIVVDSGAVSELVDESVGAVARANDVASLQGTLDRVYRSDVEAMGRRARERIEQRYTWPRVLQLQLARYALLARRQSVSIAELSSISGAL